VGGQAVEAFGEKEVAILFAGDFLILGQFFGHRHELLLAIQAEGVIEAGGEEARLEARGAEEGLLGEGDALDGEELLGIDGLVEGHEVVGEFGEILEVFKADDGKGGGGEAVFAGILGGAGLAFRSAWAGGVSGISTIGGKLFFGRVLFGMRLLFGHGA